MSTNPTPVRFAESASCGRCGRYGAYVFDGESFCADCYATRCSCCPEFGIDDLWTRDAAGDVRPSAATTRDCSKAN